MLTPGAALASPDLFRLAASGKESGEAEAVRQLAAWLSADHAGHEAQPPRATPPVLGAALLALLGELEVRPARDVMEGAPPGMSTPVSFVAGAARRADWWRSASGRRSWRRCGWWRRARGG
eukprot:scaffold2624_cov282-Prasinococcus_capsulatus_cf.AAC.4